MKGRLNNWEKVCTLNNIFLYVSWPRLIVFPDAEIGQSTAVEIESSPEEKLKQAPSKIKWYRALFGKKTESAVQDRQEQDVEAQEQREKVEEDCNSPSSELEKSKVDDSTEEESSGNNENNENIETEAEKKNNTLWSKLL